MATSFTGCDLLDALTCLQFGNCGQAGPIVPMPQPAPPNPAPDAPTNLTAVPGDGQVTLRWTPSTATDVTEYFVFSSPTPGANQGDLNHGDVEGAAANSFVVRPLPNGVTRHYVVIASDAGGAISDPSNEVAATPVSSTGTDRTPLHQWGQFGDGNGTFDFPKGVAVSPNSDNVYVMDTQNFLIQRFGPTGQFRNQWGSEGFGNGQFRFANGAAVDGAGNVYVVDFSNRNVQKFDADGDLITSWNQAGAPFNENLNPVDVAVGPENTVYVTDQDDYVYRFNSNGTVLTRWGDGDGPFTDSGPGTLEHPNAIATDAQGNVYVSQETTDRIEKFSFNGTHLGGWGGEGSGDGQFRNARGITYTPSGRIVVADTGNDRIQEFTPEGVFLSKFGSQGSTNTQFASPRDVASDCRSRLYVVDERNHRVMVFGDPQSQLPPCDEGTGPGEGKRLAGTGEPPALLFESAAGTFRASLATTRITRGRQTLRGARFDEKGIAARGRFGGRLGSRRRGLSMLAPYAGGGTWRTGFDVRADVVKRSGTARGHTLAISRRKSGGRVCIKFSTRFSIVGQTPRVNGTFRAVGGTGAGAKLVASGRFKQTYRANRRSTMTGSGKASNGRVRKLPAACRRLARGR
jgi:sugar lactone lactonase YvrE